MRKWNVYSAYFWWHDRIEGIYSSSMLAFPCSSTCPFLFVSHHSHSWVILTSLLSLAHVELLPTIGNSLFPSMWSMHYFSKDSIYVFSSQEPFFLTLEQEMLLLSNEAATGLAPWHCLWRTKFSLLFMTLFYTQGCVY